MFSGPSRARKLAGREGGCKVPGAPPSLFPCRKSCGAACAWRFQEGKQFHRAREFRNKHEKIAVVMTLTPELALCAPMCFRKFVRRRRPTTPSCTLVQHRRCDCPCGSVQSANPKLELIIEKRIWPSVGVRPKPTKLVLNARMCFNVLICRGSHKANVACSKCKTVFRSISSRIAREKACDAGTVGADPACRSSVGA